MPLLHQMQMSGNCYKARLAARQAGCELTLRDYPLLGGETRKPEFLAKNANGRVPLLEWEDGRTLPESNAIIWHLSEGSHIAPPDAWARAQALSWMFFEQYSHEPYVAVARYWLAYAPKEQMEAKRTLVPEWHAKGNYAISVMDRHLSKHDWFAGSDYSVADISLFAYTHCADEGGFDLSSFPAVQRWVNRVREQPGHISLWERV
ncbi:MAG TPA: glutathione S-transferase family protein [Rhizomicrobium sp.]|jgi:glutathione S-transferase|nr:glutathione S-transferase family protein [Rhizomicrobium sp.]